MIRTAAVAALLLAIVGATAGASPSLNGRIEAQKRRAGEIHQRLREKRVELHYATVKVGNLQGQLDQTNSAISQVNRRLGSLSYEQRRTERRLAWNTLQLSAAKRTLLLHDAMLKHRLVDIYEHGDYGYFSVLLAARSFSDFVERWEDLRLLVAANQRAVRARRAAEKRVASAQGDLEATQIALARQADEQRRARNQLDTLADERRNLVGLADAQRRHVAGQVAEMESLSAAEEAQLEALILARQREIEAQREAARRAAALAGGPPPAVSGAPGALSWPVSGTITSPFGWRRNPFSGAPDFHQGLDIGAASGTTIIAPAAGTVISAGWYGGYGNFILIDQGGGMVTGFGHCSQIFVANGQTVQKGQAIGAVGSTGVSTGPHLHFEVRINGKPVDPVPYLH